MGHLVIPNFQNQKMGKVSTQLTLTNRADRIRAESGDIDFCNVRSTTVENAVVDTGATLLCLPKGVIDRLGLTFDRDVPVTTATGVKTARIFRDVELTIGDRTGTFDCLELPGGTDVLLGVTPMEILGLEPDLQNQCLRELPTNFDRTYLSAL